MSFADIIATRNGTEVLNFHIRNTMTATVKVLGNRLVCIVACHSRTMLAKSCRKRFSSFANVKHATFTARYTVNEVGSGERDIFLILPTLSDSLT